VISNRSAARRSRSIRPPDEVLELDRPDDVEFGFAAVGWGAIASCGVAENARRANIHKRFS